VNSLIFGSSGFVGRALKETLLSKDGGKLKLAQRRPSDQGFGARVEVHVLPKSSSLLTTDQMNLMLKDVDTVYFLASATPRSLSGMNAESRAEALEDNAKMPVLVAKAAALRSVSRFIYVSSCGVHGEFTTTSAFTENSTFDIHDPYTNSKALAEKALLDAKAAIPHLTIVRPPMVYGPGLLGPMRHLLKCVERGIPLPLGGIRDNRRSLIGVRNLCEFLYVCANADAARNEIYLIADNEKLSTREFLELAAQAATTRSRLIPVPAKILSAVLAAIGKKRLFDRVFGNYEIDDTKARHSLKWSSPYRVIDELSNHYFPSEFQK
jgi:nucleoside-diphosphate-sugar epimerase